MPSSPSPSSPFGDDVAPPTIGALTRLTWLAFRERIYAAVLEAGYDDLQPAHVLLFRYPSIADLRPTELADQSGMSKQAVNDLLRQMEARGYLSLRPDPSDGRARMITLTERGSELMEFARSASHAISTEWAEAIGAERFELVCDALRDLIAAADGTPAAP